MVVEVNPIDYDRTALERQIAATDREIDQLVYQLYGLTAAEIKIVEGRRSGDCGFGNADCGMDC